MTYFLTQAFELTHGRLHQEQCAVRRMHRLTARCSPTVYLICVCVYCCCWYGGVVSSLSESGVGVCSMSNNKDVKGLPASGGAAVGTNAPPAAVSGREKTDDQKNYAFGAAPIWVHPAFIDVFVDETSTAPNPPSKPLQSNAFTASVELLMACYSNIVSNSTDWISGFTAKEMANFTLLLPVLSEIKNATQRSYINSKSEKLLWDALTDIVMRMRVLPVGGFIVRITTTPHHTHSFYCHYPSPLPVPVEAISHSCFIVCL